MKAFWLCAFALAVVVVPSRGAAQQSAVSGVVVESSSGRALSGAQVSVQGTRLRAVSDAQGRFRIDGLAGSEVTLRVIMLGYAPLVSKAASVVRVDPSRPGMNGESTVPNRSVVA